MIYAEILSGGIGERFGSKEIPKQYIEIEGKPIIIYTLKNLVDSNLFDKIIICCKDSFKEYLKSQIKKYFNDVEKIEICDAGNTRNETMMMGCKYIEKNFGINDNDIVLTIDAVRMFTSKRIIEDNVNMAKKYSAVATFYPVTDTVMESTDGNIIKSMPIRKNMYQAQAPQTFNLKKLIKYYNNVSEEDKEFMTDVGKIFFLNGEDVHMVKGDYKNFKITYKEDIEIAREYLKYYDTTKT